MSLRSATRLIYLQNKQSVIRLRYDLGREIVVLMSSSILLGLFFYIFQDFLQQKISGISGTLQLTLTRGWLAVVLLLIGPVCGGRLRELWRGTTNLCQFAARSGEDPNHLRWVLITQTALLLIIFYGSFWLVLVPRFIQDVPRLFIVWQFVSLGLVAIRALWLSTEDPQQRPQQLKPILSDQTQGRAATLLSWRWYQLIKRNRLSRLCFGIALVAQCFHTLLIWQNFPIFVLILVCLVTSLLLATAVTFQLEEDMHAVWFERQLGCSHEEFVAVYQRLCLFIGFGFAALVLLEFLILAPNSLLAGTWKTLPIVALCPVVLPSIMFQLAPDRPQLQIMVVGLIGLFIGTAIFAHGLSLVLVPLLVIYAKQYQANNFYRS